MFSQKKFFFEKKNSQLTSNYVIDRIDYSQVIWLTNDTLCVLSMDKDYDKIKSSLKTFDIVLFSGEGEFSKIIQFITVSDYSHIGLIITGDDLKSIGLKPKNDKLRDPDDLYIIHSNKGFIRHVRDVTKNQTISGVQINSLSRIIEFYKGRCFIRRLNGEIRIDFAQLKRSVKSLRNKEYETNYCEMMCATTWILGGCSYTDLDTVFCSELVAQIYIDNDIFDDEVTPSNKYSPRDFSEEEENLPLRKGLTFDEEIEVSI